MTTERTVSSKAPDQKAGMTLAELRQFLNDCDQVGIDPDTHPTVSIGWRQQIQKLTATGPERETYVLHSRGY